jgi:uncharacterized membrane protein YhhN
VRRSRAQAIIGLVLEIALPAVTAALVITHLIAQSRQRPALMAITKTLASVSFVTLAVSRYSPGSPYSAWIVTALVLGAAGDVLLLRDRTFDAGLGAFLCGHLCFVVAFHHRLAMGQWKLAILAAVTVLAILVYRWLWPHLGRRRVPVALYMAGIAAMLWGSTSVSFFGPLPWWTGLAGVLFTISDITVARNRFVTTTLANRVIGLPMYYTAQVLFALSIP